MRCNVFIPLRSEFSLTKRSECANSLRLKTAHTRTYVVVTEWGSNGISFSPDFLVYVIRNSIYVMIRADTSVPAVSTARTPTKSLFNLCTKSLQTFGAPFVTWLNIRIKCFCGFWFDFFFKLKFTMGKKCWERFWCLHSLHFQIVGEQICCCCCMCSEWQALHKRSKSNQFEFRINRLLSNEDADWWKFASAQEFSSLATHSRGAAPFSIRSFGNHRSNGKWGNAMLFKALAESEDFPQWKSALRESEMEEISNENGLSLASVLFPSWFSLIVPPHLHCQCICAPEKDCT